MPAGDSGEKAAAEFLDAQFGQDLPDACLRVAARLAGACGDDQLVLQRMLPADQLGHRHLVSVRLELQATQRVGELAAGRKLLPENGATALLHGASASITGNMLTTSGSTIAEDMVMLQRLGLTNS